LAAINYRPYREYHTSRHIFYADQPQKDQHPSGTHEYLQKQAALGFWKGMGEDESRSVMVDREFAVEDIRVFSAETESNGTITVDLYDIGEEVEIGDSVLTHKAIEIVDLRETAGDAFGELDNTAVDAPNESNCTAVDVYGPSGDVRGESPGNSYNATLDADGERVDASAAELENPVNMAVDAALESDKATEVLRSSLAIDVLDTEEVNLAAFDCDIMDLDMPEEKNSTETDWVELFRAGDSTEETTINLYSLSEDNNSQSFGNIDSWQVVNWPRGVAFQDGREGWGTPSSKRSTGLDLKELLQEWDCVFQRK
jgi:hypothetical protein